MNQYVVMVFEKDGENGLVSQYNINQLTLAELQGLFCIDEFNSMFDCYLVSESQREYIEKDIGIRLNLLKFDYFISCESNI